MSRRKSKGLVPAHGDGPGRRKGFWPADRRHRVVVKDAAGHMVIEFGRYVGPGADAETWFTLSPSKFPTIIVLHDGDNSKGYVDDSTTIFTFLCKVCRDSGVPEGLVGEIKRSVVEAALDDMARIYGVEDDTPRSMSLPLLAPDSL